MAPSSPLSLASVQQAHARIRPWILRTPLIRSTHRGAWLKLENLQHTGAYKIRGALNALLIQKEAGDSRPVVAASAGNHGAGVAWAAHKLGLQAIVAVPKNAPKSKINRITKLGAQVVLHGDNFDECLVWAQRKARERDWRLLHAFDDPDVIAGQGTIALEMLALNPDVVVVPIGGGGLAAGHALVLRETGIRLIGVQVEGVDAMASAIRGGPTRIEPCRSVADSLRVREAGLLTRTLCEEVLDDIVLVSEEATINAMRSLASRERIRAEGAGAVTIAALDQIRGHRRIALVSGGNTDLEFGQLRVPIRTTGLLHQIN